MLGDILDMRQSMQLNESNGVLDRPWGHITLWASALISPLELASRKLKIQRQTFNVV